MAKIIAQKCIACGASLEVLHQGTKIICPYCHTVNIVEVDQENTEISICPECGAVNPKDANHCSQCGMRFIFPCPKCGAPNSTGVIFCIRCGTNIQKELEYQQSMETMRLSKIAEENKKKEKAKKRIILSLVMGFLCVLLLIAIKNFSNNVPQNYATQTPVPVLGSLEKPIKVFFAPVYVQTNELVTGGEMMTKVLNQATGFNFEVVVPSSYSATIKEMCASPDDTMGFMPNLGYVFANELCGVDVAFEAVSPSLFRYSEFLVSRDSDIQSLEDLAGKKWGHGSVVSTLSYMAPLVMLNEAGIEPGENVKIGALDCVKAVYDGEVDFSTVFFQPPDKPEGEPEWKEGDAPDIPDELVSTCQVEEASILCNGWKIRDARGLIQYDAPDVIEKVRILAISQRIPGDTLSFGPDFPEDVRVRIETALLDFSKTDDWKNTIGTDDFFDQTGYDWSGIAKAEDTDYDFVRTMVKTVGLKLDDLDKY